MPNVFATRTGRISVTSRRCSRGKKPRRSGAKLGQCRLAGQGMHEKARQARHTTRCGRIGFCVGFPTDPSSGQDGDTRGWQRQLSLARLHFLQGPLTAHDGKVEIYRPEAVLGAPSFDDSAIGEAPPPRGSTAGTAGLLDFTTSQMEGVGRVQLGPSCLHAQDPSVSIPTRSNRR